MTRWLLVALLLALAGGCTVGPTDIQYGKDTCASCRMQITDPRFGSELVTRHGKAYTFDAVECLVGFTLRGTVPAAETHSVWVSDFANPGHLIDARTARYLKTDAVRSPMGLNVLAFAGEAEREAARGRYQGEAISWEQLPEVVRQGAVLERRMGGAEGPAPARPH